MTGKFFFLNKNAKKFKTSFYYNIDESKDNKHNRLIFSLSKKQKLIYNDVRKFGFIKILDKNGVFKCEYKARKDCEMQNGFYNVPIPGKS